MKFEELRSNNCAFGNDPKMIIYIRNILKTDSDIKPDGDSIKF